LTVIIANWTFFIVHKSASQKRPADVVLLVDATISMWLWFSERIKRVQNIASSVALKFLKSDHRNRIAIAQFDYSHGKILLELGKWQAPNVSA
jgi:Mg-chelatase subunit ChlD